MQRKPKYELDNPGLFASQEHNAGTNQQIS